MKEVLGIGVILGSTSCKYKFSLTCPDTIFGRGRITDIEDGRISMTYVFVSHRHERIAADCGGVIVMYNCQKGKKKCGPG